MTFALNLGSGQRRFKSVPGLIEWVNVDCVSRDGEEPDLVCDIRHLPYEDNSVDLVVMHHVAEHFGCGEAPFPEAYRVLRPGASLIVTVPDMWELANAWKISRISTQVYMTNIYGAYRGEEGDRHKWGFDNNSLIGELDARSEWAAMKLFDWREIPGSAIAKDFWILGIEAVK